MPIELTVRDTDTGDRDSCTIGDGPGGYVVTCGPGCYIANEQVHANGTVQLTIKPMPRYDPDEDHALTCCGEPVANCVYATP